jgi:poly-gamma-glutamate capsule biosynthesis protein CapA/YwtB (metallophosphatase superfamily)
MSKASDQARRAKRGSKVLVLALVVVALLAMFGFALAVVDADPEASEPTPPSLPDVEAIAPRILLAVAEFTPPPDPDLSPSPEPSASPEPSVSPDPSASPGVLAEPAPPVAVESVMPVVPVAGFWSKRDGIKKAAVVRALESGEIDGFKRVVVEKRIADQLAAALGIEIHPDVRRRELDGLTKAVRKGALGLVAATSTGPSMRTLDIGRSSLIGIDRVKRVEDWPLRVSLQLAPDETWAQDSTWVLVAGGDSFTDRGVYDTVVKKGKGVDYPFNGGTAKVTGHGCCDPVFNDNVVPRYVLTGNKGAVRALFKGAELALANHEQPVTELAQHHTSGTRFSGMPALTKIFTRAGIDFLSLANNHIGDYGSQGIRDTRRILRQNGIAFGGAGKDLDQARKVNSLDARGTQVAIIPCLDIVKVYWAEDGKAGATPCVDQYIKKDIRKAKRAGADVIIVFPHWGVEYTRQPLTAMRKHSQRWVDAGADLVIGAHSHVAGSIEDIDGSTVLYSLGNLIFDQHWSTNTMISMVLEATFHGGQLVEVRLRPYIIHNTSQPNFLDPDSGGGRRLLKQVRQASDDWLDW